MGWKNDPNIKHLTDKDLYNNFAKYHIGEWTKAQMRKYLIETVDLNWFELNAVLKDMANPKLEYLDVMFKHRMFYT